MSDRQGHDVPVAESVKCRFTGEQGSLSHAVAAALRESVALNRSTLAPFRLPQIAKQIVTGFLEFAASKEKEPAEALGYKLGQQGLALGSMLALGDRLLRELQARQASPEETFALCQYMNVLIGSVVAGDGNELRRQRDELQASLERTLRSREDELQRLVLELSTPIMPIYDGILVLPLISRIDNERAQKIAERLLDEIKAQHARLVIIDVTGVTEMDQRVGVGLLRMARAAQFLGAKVVLVGLRPEFAATLSGLDLDMTPLITLANLRKGLEYALREEGLFIQRRRPLSLSKEKKA
jgi:rsbT co-antagonist protein RsbR